MAVETVLITGASVGIGRELALLFAADGFDLVLVARDQKRLEEVAGECRKKGAGGARVMPADLADPSAPGRLAEELRGLGIIVDILVNNAGFGSSGDFWEADLREQLDMVQVNVAALVGLTRLFLPAMIQRGRGRIMNVASVAGFVPGPRMATYYATKAFVISFSMALREECRKKGVTVTAVCPGSTKTEFFTRAGITNSKLIESGAMSAEVVAKIGYRGTMKGKGLVVTGVKNKVMALGASLTPKWLGARIAGGMNRDR